MFFLADINFELLSKLPAFHLVVFQVGIEAVWREGTRYYTVLLV